MFARHEGKDIDRGWHFYVLSKEGVEGAEPAIKAIKPLGLEGLGAKRCDPTNLKACIIEVVSRARPLLGLARPLAEVHGSPSYGGELAAVNWRL